MIRRFPLWSIGSQHKSSRRSRQHKSVDLLGLALAVVMLGLLLPARASAASLPWADLICNNFGGGVDSTPACQNAYNQLKNTYATFNNRNVSGAAALGTSFAQSDAIWMAVGHGAWYGGQGFIFTSSSPGSMVVSSSSYGSCSAPNGCLSALVAGKKLSRVRLMMFVGCNTDGSLPQTAIAAGADAAIAFSEDIGTDAANYWVGRFFLHAMQGNTIQAAAASAHWDLLAIGYGDQGLGSIHIWGNASEKLIPAAYGV